MQKSPKSLLNSVRAKADTMISRMRVPTKDLSLVVRKSVGDLDAQSFQSWYESLDLKRRTRYDRITSKLNRLIKQKAKQRTDARIATAGRLPSELTSEQYEIIYREELDEIKNSLKLGVLQGTLGIALASLGINLWL
ncbi:MAG: hypothetical protein F4W90_04665 [Gammaproteobacteria bacterium]|nr:hypothetical protein [Gammaproteobacteria bacterium]